MINKVILIGNLGQDPEDRTLQDGTSLARFSVATNENYKDKNDEWQQLTEWHNIVCWRATADRVLSTLKKGTMVYLEGKLTSSNWKDDQGADRRTTEVEMLSFRVLQRPDQIQSPSQ